MKFDTTKLLETLPINEELIKIEKSGIGKRGESKRDKIKRRSKKTGTPNTTGFCHNSITLVMMNDGDKTQPLKEITIKIFQNGVFHMTGVLHESYDTCTIRNLLKIIWSTSKESLKDCPEMYEILNRRVVLMNYTTKLSSNDTVAREALHNTIRALKSETIVSHYDPDVYPGVKINIGTGKWTAKIFRTGKIILTGIVEHSECLEFMKQLLSLFELALPKKLKLDHTLNTAVQQSTLSKLKAT
jgi:TATA-box binding protein (TBP) (component of TFIID and TFIIIB)